MRLLLIFNKILFRQLTVQWAHTWSFNPAYWHPAPFQIVEFILRSYTSRQVNNVLQTLWLIWTTGFGPWTLFFLATHYQTHTGMGSSYYSALLHSKPVSKGIHLVCLLLLGEWAWEWVSDWFSEWACAPTRTNQVECFSEPTQSPWIYSHCHLREYGSVG